MIIGKKSNLEQGYVFAPYIPMTTSANIVEYGSKKISRKRKIKRSYGYNYKVQ
jgi:hypothetical protein